MRYYHYKIPYLLNLLFLALLIQSCQFGNQVQIIPGNQIQSKQPFYTFSFDLNNDGTLEQVCCLSSDADTSSVIILKNNTNVLHSLIKYPFYSFGFIGFSDFNKDGFDECIMISEKNSSLYFSVLNLYSGQYIIDSQKIFTLDEELDSKDFSFIQIISAEMNSPEKLIFSAQDKNRIDSYLFMYNLENNNTLVRKFENSKLTPIHAFRESGNRSSILFGVNPNDFEQVSQIFLCNTNLNIIKKQNVPAGMKLTSLLLHQNLNTQNIFAVCNSSAHGASIFKFNSSLENLNSMQLELSENLLSDIFYVRNQYYLYLLNKKKGRIYLNTFCDDLIKFDEFQIPLSDAKTLLFLQTDHCAPPFLLTVNQDGYAAINDIERKSSQKIQNFHLDDSRQLKVLDISRMNNAQTHVLLSNFQSEFILTIYQNNDTGIFFLILIVLITGLSILAYYQFWKLYLKIRLSKILNVVVTTGTKPMVILDKKGNIFFFNNKFESIAGELFLIPLKNGKKLIEINPAYNLYKIFGEQLSGKSQMVKYYYFSASQPQNIYCMSCTPLLISDKWFSGCVIELATCSDHKLQSTSLSWLNAFNRVINMILEDDSSMDQLNWDTKKEYLAAVRDQLRTFEIPVTDSILTEIHRNDFKICIDRITREHNNIQIESSFSGDFPVFLMNLSHFNILLTNLLGNCIDAAGESGLIHVNCSLVEYPDQNFTHSIEILIADNGHGIQKSIHEFIFNPGFTTRENRLGVGLAIVKQIISLYDGEIQIDSSSEIGTTVVLHVPVIREQT